MNPTATDMVFICGDLTVKLVPTEPGTPGSDPRGVWKDAVHQLKWDYERFTPCDPARDPLGRSPRLFSYTVNQQYVYLCPEILDLPKGRSLERYKDRDLIGEWLETYVLLPVVMFNELFYTKLFFPPRKLIISFSRKSFISFTTSYD